MPIICENINEKDVPLIKKANYFKTDEFCKVYPAIPSETPLGPNYKFKPCVLPTQYKKSAEIIENFKIRSDDTWVISFPKCGTTWTQAMVWMLLNNCDYELEKKKTLSAKFPFFELETLYNIDMDTFKSFEWVERKSSPRFIKTHLPVGLLPREIWSVKPKIIYVARNPKDVAISLFHHYRNLQGYPHSFEDFIEIFMNDLVFYGSLHSHILDYWKLRDEENILFINYEDMKKDHFSVIKNVANFLNVSYSDDEMKRLQTHLTVDSMRSNKMANNDDLANGGIQSIGMELIDPTFKFIRKGESGNFKREMTNDLIDKFDKWTKCELKNSDFQFSM